MPSAVAMLNFGMLLPPRGFGGGRKLKWANLRLPRSFNSISSAKTYKIKAIPKDTYLGEILFYWQYTAAVKPLTEEETISFVRGSPLWLCKHKRM